MMHTHTHTHTHANLFHISEETEGHPHVRQVMESHCSSFSRLQKDKRFDD